MKELFAAIAVVLLVMMVVVVYSYEEQLQERDNIINSYEAAVQHHCSQWSLMELLYQFDPGVIVICDDVDYPSYINWKDTLWHEWNRYLNN